METWMSHCGPCRYNIPAWINLIKFLMAWQECQSCAVSLPPPERYPPLLWLQGSGPSDLLGSVSHSLRGPQDPARRLAHTTARPPGRRATFLYLHGLLWRGEFPAEARVPWETLHQGVWTDGRDPPGKSDSSQHPDESWSLKTQSLVSRCTSDENKTWNALTLHYGLWLSCWVTQL